MKPDASCLVWKDSMRIQNRLMAREATLPSLLAGVPDARFILPVRQPLDCALSNIRTGKSQTLLARASDSLPDVLDAVLAAIVWVLKQRDRWPERFHAFTEKADARDVALGYVSREAAKRDYGVALDAKGAVDAAATAALRKVQA